MWWNCLRWVEEEAEHQHACRMKCWWTEWIMTSWKQEELQKSWEMIKFASICTSYESDHLSWSRVDCPHDEFPQRYMGASQHGSDLSLIGFLPCNEISHVGNQPKNKRLIIQWWALLFSSLEPWHCHCLQITKSLPRTTTTTKSIGQTNKVHTCVPVPEALHCSACDNHR